MQLKKSVLVLLATVVLCVASEVSAFADVIIGTAGVNTNITAGNIQSPGNAGWIAVGWTMNAGQDFQLSDAVAYLRVFGPLNITTAGYETNTASIWSDSAGVPGSELTTLSSPDFMPVAQLSAQAVDFTPDSPLMLHGGQTYWLVITAAYKKLYWYGTSSDSDPSGPNATYAGLWQSASNAPVIGPQANSGDSAFLQVNGTAVSNSPEPGSAILLGTGGLLLFFLQRRRASQRRGIGLAALAVAAGATVARADTILATSGVSNAVANGSNLFANNAGWAAAGWTMNAGQDFQLSGVEIYLKNDQTSNQLVQDTGSIWSDNGGVPGTELVTLTSPVFNGTAVLATRTAVDFTPDSPFTMQGGSTYWLVVTGAWRHFLWYAATSTPTGSDATYAGFWDNLSTNPVSSPLAGTGSPASLQITGTAVSNSPEPGSAVLLGTGGLLLFFLQRRRASQRCGIGLAGLAIVVLGAGGSVASADTILAPSGISSTAKAGTVLVAYGWMAAGWTMNPGQDFQLNGLEASILENGPSFGDPLDTASIWSDNAGEPGTQIVTLSSLTFTGATHFVSQTTVDFTPDSPFTLQGGDTYWLLLTPSFKNFNWYAATSTPTGADASYAGFWVGTGTAGMNPVAGTGNPAALQITGTAISNSPEPSAAILLGTGGLLVCLLRRRCTPACSQTGWFQT